MEEKVLIWVTKQFAKLYEECESDNTKINRLKEYLERHREDLQDEASLNAMKDDLLMSTGLNLSARESFSKATREAEEAEKTAYDLLEKYDEEKISITEKVKALSDELNPVKDMLDNINKTLNSIAAHPFNNTMYTLREFNSLTRESKNMLQFLIDNYKQFEEEIKK